MEVIEVQATQTSELELMVFSQEHDPDKVVRAAFPLYRDAGAKSTAVVYFELEPGKELARHTDSAEEVLVVLEGEVEATVGDETGRVGPGAVVLVPALEPHGARNVGDTVARVVGVFSSNTIVSVFDEPFEDAGRVLGTPPPA
jgi:quercetin dioxygenase-like cupin family protein